MNEHQIKKEVDKRLRKGESKLELYHFYKDKISDIKLRLILASRPDAKSRVMVKTSHSILKIIWIIIALFTIAEGITGLIDYGNIGSLIHPAITVILCIGIINFNHSAFLGGIVWLSMKCIISLFEMAEYGYLFEDKIIYSILISIYLIGIILMFNIRKRVFSYYKWYHPEKDDNGEYFYY